jgi:hypothetical protein
MQQRRPFASDSSRIYNSNASEGQQVPATRKHDPQLFDAMLQLRECRLENERLAKQFARDQVETRAASEITTPCSLHLLNTIGFALLRFCMCSHRACNGSMRTTQQRR